MSREFFRSDCVFCKIQAGEIPSPRLLEGPDAFVIRDLQPQAREHLLVIPKMHFQSIVEASESPESVQILTQCLQLATQAATQVGIRDSGFRVVTNAGRDAGQSVHNLHFHVLGGQALRGSFG